MTNVFVCSEYVTEPFKSITFKLDCPENEEEAAEQLLDVVNKFTAMNPLLSFHNHEITYEPARLIFTKKL